MVTVIRLICVPCCKDRRLALLNGHSFIRFYFLCKCLHFILSVRHLQMLALLYLESFLSVDFWGWRGLACCLSMKLMKMESDSKQQLDINWRGGRLVTLPHISLSAFLLALKRWLRWIIKILFVFLKNLLSLM